MRRRRMDFEFLKWRWSRFEFSGRQQFFEDFAKDYRRAIRTELTRRQNIEKKEGKEPNRFRIVRFDVGYFDFTCYIYNLKTRKYVYVSIGDVRFFPRDEWYKEILVRTAENTRDYVGGRNHWCKLEELVDKIVELTKE